jgi:ankyrin repeat protein
MALLPMLEFCNKHYPSPSSLSSLHLAIHLNYRDVVRDLINGARHSFIDVNARDARGQTPVIHALEAIGTDDTGPCVEILDILLVHPEVDVNLRDSSGQTPLSYAMAYNIHNIFAKVFSHPDCDPNVQLKAYSNAWKDGATLLSYPSLNIIEAGFQDGLPLLVLAFLDGRPDIVDLLLSHPKIDVNACKPLGVHGYSQGASLSPTLHHHHQLCPPLFTVPFQGLCK